MGEQMGLGTSNRRPRRREEGNMKPEVVLHKSGESWCIVLLLPKSVTSLAHDSNAIIGFYRRKPMKIAKEIAASLGGLKVRVENGG